MMTDTTTMMMTMMVVMITIIMMTMMTMAPVQCVKGFWINGAHDRESSGVWFAPPELKSLSRWIFGGFLEIIYIFLFFSICSPGTEIIILLSALSCHHHHGIIEFFGTFGNYFNF